MAKVGNFTKETLKNGAKVIGGHRVKYVSDDKNFVILYTSYGYFYGVYLTFESDGAHVDEEKTPKASKEHCFNSLDECKKFWKVGEYAGSEEVEAKEKAKKEPKADEKPVVKTNDANVLKAYKNGMFYEFFDEDAVKVARTLGLSLVEGGDQKSVGFPVSDEKGNFVKLVKAGYDVKVFNNSQKTEKPKAHKQKAAVPKHKKDDTPVETKQLQVTEPIQSRSMEVMRENFLKVCEEQGIDIDKTCIKQSKDDTSHGTLVGYKEKKAVIEISWIRKEEGKEKQYIFG